MTAERDMSSRNNTKLIYKKEEKNEVAYTGSQAMYIKCVTKSKKGFSVFNKAEGSSREANEFSAVGLGNQ